MVLSGKFLNGVVLNLVIFPTSATCLNCPSLEIMRPSFLHLPIGWTRSVPDDRQQSRVWKSNRRMDLSVNVADGPGSERIKAVGGCVLQSNRPFPSSKSTSRPFTRAFRHYSSSSSSRRTTPTLGFDRPLVSQRYPGLRPRIYPSRPPCAQHSLLSPGSLLSPHPMLPVPKNGGRSPFTSE